MTTKKIPAPSTMTDPAYLTTLPKAVPADRVLVHNHIKPTRRIGSRGFRIWLSRPDHPNLAVCACGWAPELGRHYRVATRDD